MPIIKTEWHFTVVGEAMGAPRQVRSDAWRPRDCVIRYRQWRDLVRKRTPKNITQEPEWLNITVYLPIPPSWSKKKKVAMAGKPHRSKPDADNLLKGLADSIWSEDSCIYFMSCTKKWDDGGGPRVVVFVR